MDASGHDESRTSLFGRQGPSEKLLLTAEELAQALGIGRSKVYELMASGELRSVAIGRLRRVPAERLAEFVANLEVERS